MTHSKDALARALLDADLPAMAAKATDGYYHDFLSPLDDPAMTLADDLAKAGTPAALALRRRHINGEFDATTEESEEWFSGPEGRSAMRRLMRKP